MINDARKHFEASCNQLEKIGGFRPRLVREAVKVWLVENKFIRSSTTELDETELERIADLLGKIAWRHENTPPAEKGIMTIDFIIEKLK